MNGPRAINAFAADMMLPARPRIGLALGSGSARVTEATLWQDRPEIQIQPPLGDVRFMDFDCAEGIIEIGYRSAAEQLVRWSGMQT